MRFTDMRPLNPALTPSLSLHFTSNRNARSHAEHVSSLDCPLALSPTTHIVSRHAHTICPSCLHQSRTPRGGQVHPVTGGMEMPWTLLVMPLLASVHPLGLVWRDPGASSSETPGRALPQRTFQVMLLKIFWSAHDGHHTYIPGMKLFLIQTSKLGFHMHGTSVDLSLTSPCEIRKIQPSCLVWLQAPLSAHYHDSCGDTRQCSKSCPKEAVGDRMRFDSTPLSGR